jgi:hypothetical protein
MYRKFFIIANIAILTVAVFLLLQAKSAQHVGVAVFFILISAAALWRREMYLKN